MNRLESILGRLTREIGYLEKETNNRLDEGTANAGDNNYTKYARDYSDWMKISLQGQAWCAMFLSWIFVQEYGLDAAKKVNSRVKCLRMVRKYQTAV